MEHCFLLCKSNRQCSVSAGSVEANRCLRQSYCSKLHLPELEQTFVARILLWPFLIWSHKVWNAFPITLFFGLSHWLELGENRWPGHSFLCVTSFLLCLGKLLQYFVLRSLGHGVSFSRTWLWATARVRWDYWLCALCQEQTASKMQRCCLHSPGREDAPCPLLNGEEERGHSLCWYKSRLFQQDINSEYRSSAPTEQIQQRVNSVF